jgi:hypothetical protein
VKYISYILKRERTVAQKLLSSTGSPSMISSGEVTSKGSCRGSNGPSEVRGRAILPHFIAENPRKAKLRKAVLARVAATGSWNKGMTMNYQRVAPFVERPGSRTK